MRRMDNRYIVLPSNTTLPLRRNLQDTYWTPKPIYSSNLLQGEREQCSILQHDSTDYSAQQKPGVAAMATTLTSHNGITTRPFWLSQLR